VDGFLRVAVSAGWITAAAGMEVLVVLALALIAGVLEVSGRRGVRVKIYFKEKKVKRPESRERV
jgi:hypothetical protein